MFKTEKIFISIFFIIVLFLFITDKSYAAQEYTELNDKAFFIKNAYTGHYLDVSGGTAQGGTNVQQYEYNRNRFSKMVFDAFRKW